MGRSTARDRRSRPGFKTASYEDGSQLLVEQAAAAFELWWGVAPPREALPTSPEVGR